MFEVRDVNPGSQTYQAKALPLSYVPLPNLNFNTMKQKELMVDVL